MTPAVIRPDIGQLADAPLWTATGEHLLSWSVDLEALLHLVLYLLVLLLE